MTKTSPTRSGPDQKLKPTSNKFQPLRHGESIPNIYINSPEHGERTGPSKEISITKSNSTCNSSSKPNSPKRYTENSQNQMISHSPRYCSNDGVGKSGRYSRQNSGQSTQGQGNDRDQSFLRPSSTSSGNCNPGNRERPNSEVLELQNQIRDQTYEQPTHSASPNRKNSNSVKRSQTSNSFDDSSSPNNPKNSTRTRQRSNGSLRYDKNPYKGGPNGNINLINSEQMGGINGISSSQGKHGQSMNVASSNQVRRKLITSSSTVQLRLRGHYIND